MNWMSSVVKLSAGKLLAIDGKTIRRSFEHAWDKSGMAHLLSLFVQNNGQVFSQLKTEGKGQELSGTLQLLGMLDLNGAIVTIDALGCQKEVCQTILDRGGDYLLCVKQKNADASRCVGAEPGRDDPGEVQRSRARLRRIGRCRSWTDRNPTSLGEEPIGSTIGSRSRAIGRG